LPPQLAKTVKRHCWKLNDIDTDDRIDNFWIYGEQFHNFMKDYEISPKEKNSYASRTNFCSQLLELLRRPSPDVGVPADAGGSLKASGSPEGRGTAGARISPDAGVVTSTKTETKAPEGDAPWIPLLLAGLALLTSVGVGVLFLRFRAKTLSRLAKLDESLAHPEGIIRSVTEGVTPRLDQAAVEARNALTAAKEKLETAVSAAAAARLAGDEAREGLTRAVELYQAGVVQESTIADYGRRLEVLEEMVKGTSPRSSLLMTPSVPPDLPPSIPVKLPLGPSVDPTKTLGGAAPPTFPPASWEIQLVGRKWGLSWDPTTQCYQTDGPLGGLVMKIQEGLGGRISVPRQIEMRFPLEEAQTIPFSPQGLHEFLFRDLKTGQGWRRLIEYDGELHVTERVLYELLEMTNVLWPGL